MNKNQLINLPPINKYSSRKEWEDACWGKVIKSEELLKLLTTFHERHNLVMRAAALADIISGKTYREIVKKFWVSSQTISGIKKSLNKKIYRSYQERSKMERKKREYNIDNRVIKPKYPGRPRRTKYGTIYMPY